MKRYMKFSNFSIFAVFISGMVLLSVFTACSASEPDVDYSAVIEGNAEFLFISEGTAESKTIGDVPAIFDPDGHYETKIWKYAAADLDGDGKEEAILSVYGVAGDTGGQIILHQDGKTIYGYKTDNRTLAEIKTDGTGTYSDPTGVSEVGICRVSDFSDTGYTLDKFTYATGDYKGFDTFVVDHKSATEEEYNTASENQSKKQDIDWIEF